MLFDATLFRRIVPPLAESWRRRSFEPCRELCVELLPVAEVFGTRYHIAHEDLLLSRAAGALPFDRHYWQLLVGEILMVAAAEIPEIEIAPATLCTLCGVQPGPDAVTQRAEFAPIQQALYGKRDLSFGTKTFRPEHAGYNNVDDVKRLAEYLGAVDTAAWSADALRSLPGPADAEDREEELAQTLDWFSLFVDLYRRSADAGQVIIAEIL
jgi:hypothetical protein